MLIIDLGKQFGVTFALKFILSGRYRPYTRK